MTPEATAKQDELHEFKEFWRSEVLKNCKYRNYIDVVKSYYGYPVFVDFHYERLTKEQKEEMSICLTNLNAHLDVDVDPDLTEIGCTCEEGSSTLLAYCNN